MVFMTIFGVLYTEIYIRVFHYSDRGPIVSGPLARNYGMKDQEKIMKWLENIATVVVVIMVVAS